MRFLLLSVLLFTFLQVFAQEDYRLFQDGVQYLYYNPLQNEITTHTVGIRAAGECQLLYTNVLGVICRNDPRFGYCSSQVPSFAGHEVCQRPERTTLLVDDDRLVIMYPAAPVGADWLATTEDTTAIYGRVDSIVWQTVLGQSDSIKYISFHAGGPETPTITSLAVGKVLGVVSGVYFWGLRSFPQNLPVVGISQPEAGVQLSSTAEFFADPGAQELHFREYLPRFDLGDYTHQIDEFSLQLTSYEMNASPGRIIYRFWGSRLRYYTNGTRLSSGYDSTLYTGLSFTYSIDDERTWLDEQPGSLVPHFISGINTNSPYSTSTTVTHTNGGCRGGEKQFGYDAFVSEDAFDDEVLVFTDGNPGDRYYRGIGVPFYDYNLLGAGREGREFVYADDRFGTCGTPLDFSGLTSVRSLPLDAAISVYPNPAEQKATLQLPQTGDVYSVALADLAGRQLAFYPDVRYQLDLQVANLKQGVYLLTVSAGGAPVGRRRLVVR